MGNEHGKPEGASPTSESTAAGVSPQRSSPDKNRADPPQKSPSGSAQVGGMTPGMFITHQAGVFSDRYRGLKVLGKGSFGEVILCKDKVTGMECAVKVISKRALKKGADPTSLLREVELLKEVDHPNIMKLFEFFEDSGYYYLVGEAYAGGELFDAIVERKRFREPDAATVMKQVLSGINYMHKNSIVHRDLKPENLLLESKKEDSLIKIIDFGLSTHFEKSRDKKMKDKIGTAYYIAPEVLHGTYDEKCDVWSAGVITYILLSGSPPFYGHNEYEILRKVEAGKYTFKMRPFESVSDSAKDLIRHMLIYTPQMRYTAQEALDHPWILRMATPEAGSLPVLEGALCNMREFQSTQKLAQAAIFYIGSKLTSAEETKALTTIFRTLDKNGDGQLDGDELKHGYKELLKLKGVDVSTLDEQAIEAEVEAVLQSIDFNHNGSLEYSEFVTVAMDRKTLLTKERLRRAFDMFDTDNSGKISAEEMWKVLSLSGVQKEECDAILAQVDKNKDGEIDFDEFEEMLKTICETRPFLPTQE